MPKYRRTSNPHLSECGIRGDSLRERLRRLGLVGSAGLAAAVPFQGPKKGNVWDWLQREVFSRVTIAGTRTLAYHQHDVEGDKEAFNLLNYSGLGGERFTDIGAMSAQGRNVGGLFNFQSTIIQNRFADPQTERSSLDYGRVPFSINVGDIQGSMLNTNRFASFRKYLKGAQAQYISGRFAIKGVASEVRGSAKTLSIQGTNSAGPYYLQHSQVVRGSEEVQVDGQTMRLGQDYVINYEVGTISFVGRIIPPTSTIVVTFEALGFNTGFGKVTGVGASYDFGKIGRIGLTHMTQTAAGSGALSSRVELFQGSGAPSTPYFLQFEPLLTRPISVKLDGIPQVENIDFHFDPDNPVIFYFNRFVPFTSTIEVAYTPRPTTTVDGNRKVIGIDYRFPLGHRGSIGYSQATGELKSEANPLKGTARGIDVTYRTGPWNFRGAVRDVPSGYVSVETRGFNRNEEANDWGLRYEGKKFEIDTSANNSLITLRQVATNGDLIFRKARATNFRTSARYRPEAGVNWDLENTQTNSRNGLTESKLNRTSLSTSRSFGRLLVRGSLEQQNGRGPLAESGAGEVGNVDLRTLALDGSYTAGAAWAFRGKIGFSDVNTPSKNGSGVDHQLGLTYSPSNRFSMNAQYAKSDSGALASLGGFQTGYGLGYGGNGFSGGLSGSGFAMGGTGLTLFQTNAKYQISERASVLANMIASKSSGSLTSNSETKAYDLGIEVDMGKGHNVYLSVAQSNTKLSGIGGEVASTTLDFDLNGHPRGRFSYRFGASIFLTSSGNEQFGQDSTYLDGSLSYLLAPRHSLSLYGTTGSRTGYLPQDETHMGLAYAYQIYRNIALVSTYRFRDVRNRGDSGTTGAYRSRGIDIELTFNFGG